MIQRRLFLITVLAFAILVAGGSKIPFGLSFAGLTDQEKVNGSAQAGYWNGNIKITKDTVPNSTVLFTFTPSGGSISTAPFTLEDDNDLTDGKLPSKQYTGIAPGTYTFTESATTGYEISSIICTVTGGHGSTISIRGAVTNAVFDEGDNSVVITLAGGDAVECVFENTLVIGDIVIRKDTAPNSSTIFDFTAASTPAGHITPTTFTLQDDGTEATNPSSKTFADLDAPGVYTFTEEAETGYEITNITCTVTGTAGSTYAIAGVTNDAVFQPGEYTVNVTLMAGDVVDCTFKNEPTVGTIKITKDTAPDSATVFDFSAAGGTISPSAFTLTDNGSPATRTRTFADLNAPVSYTFAELNETGYEVTSITCAVTGSGGSTYAITGVTNDAVFQAGETTVTVSLKPGDQVECTFKNEPLKGSIKITKDTAPNSTTVFDFSASGGSISPTDFDLEDDGDESDAVLRSRTFSGLTVPVSYTFAEAVETGYKVTAITCSVTGSGGSTYAITGVTNDAVFQAGERTVTINLKLEDNVECVFKNEPTTGSITIVKDVVGGSGTHSFTFSETIPGCTFTSISASDAANGQQVCSGVLPGVAYSVTESSPAASGFLITSISCGGASSATYHGTSLTDTDLYQVGDNSVTITLDESENVTCTFVNKAVPTECGTDVYEFAIQLSDAAQGSSGTPFTINNGNHKQVIFAGGGDDWIAGGNSTDCIVGESGDDHLYGGNGSDDILVGGIGNDTLVGANGKDKLYGGPGDDVLEGGGAADLLDGGEGSEVTGDDCDGGGPPDDTFVDCETFVE